MVSCLILILSLVVVVDFGRLVYSLLTVVVSLLLLLSWFCCSCQPSMFSPLFFVDDVRFWLSYLTVFVVGVIFVCSGPGSKPRMLSLQFLLLVCLFVFSRSKFLLIYVAFEASLLPISYIIVKWGVYSERSTSAIYMLLYTALFSFPMMLVVVYMWVSLSSFRVLFDSCVLFPRWATLLFLLGFLVKLPVYGIHYWLPQAHVEAPTFGSMVLAGILLKLGGYGVYRLGPIVAFPDSVFLSWVSYFVVALLLSSVVTCFQSDVKRLVAYSSVVHITSLYVAVLFSNALTSKVFIIVLVYHGLLSPLLFYLVGLSYSLFKTRTVLMLKRFGSVSSTMVLFLVVAFCMRVPTPPFPQFLFEVLLFLSISRFSLLLFMFIIIVYTFIRLVYNLVWFVPFTLCPSYPRTSVMSLSVLEVLVSFLLLISCLWLLGHVALM